MKLVFAKFDSDGKGYITLQDFKVILANYDKNLTQKDIEMMFNETRVAKNGKIYYKQFVSILMGDNKYQMKW